MRKPPVCPNCGRTQTSGSACCPTCHYNLFSEPKDIYEYHTNLPIDGGESRLKVETVASGGNFLKADFVKTHKITELKIENKADFEYVTFKGKDGKKDQTKLQTKVIYNNYRPGSDMPNQWTLNAKSHNALIKAWGDETDNWVGKKIPITIGGEGEMQHILVDELRIE